MKYIKPNAIREGFAFAGLILIGFGAGYLWGNGGALLSVGLSLLISCELDSIAERFTNTTNWRED